MIFALDQTVLDRLPTLCMDLVAAQDIDNLSAQPEVNALLDVAVLACVGGLAGPP